MRKLRTRTFALTSSSTLSKIWICLTFHLKWSGITQRETTSSWNCLKNWPKISWTCALNNFRHLKKIKDYLHSAALHDHNFYFILALNLYSSFCIIDKKYVNQLIKKNFGRILVLSRFLSWFQVLDYQMIAFWWAIGFSIYSLNYITLKCLGRVKVLKSHPVNTINDDWHGYGRWKYIAHIVTRNCLKGEFFEMPPPVEWLGIAMKMPRHDYIGSIIIVIHPK